MAPPNKDSAGLLEIFKTSPTRHLNCLNWDDLGEDLSIWGTENDEISYQRFEFLLLPCNYLHTEFGPKNDTIAEECVADHDAQMEYLGNLRLTIMTTVQDFN